MKRVNAAILGFGTVGNGTYKLLTDNAALIAQRTGAEVSIKRILEINQSAIDASGLDKSLFTADFNDIINDNDIDIVVEVMGGIEPASGFMLSALNAGKHVVSSNKAAIAASLPKLKDAAKANNVKLLYEASVCGAIPVLSAISGNLSGNNFTEISGIVNGTSNYILTQMAEGGMSYGDALKKAQGLGFAEADPTADVEGIDAANKICILADLAMGFYQDPMSIDRTGISKISADDIKAAKASGKKIKLIAMAVNDHGKVSLSVRPQLVDSDSRLYGIDYEFNGISLKTDFAEEIFLCGRGAGSLPTGSAVAGDIIEIAKYLASRE